MAVKILRLTDRITLEVGPVTFKLAPLSYSQKAELSSCTKFQDGKEVIDTLKSTFLAIKFSLKEIKGVEDLDGKPYKLEFEGGVLKDECVEDILNLEQSSELTIAAFQLMQGIPKEIVSPITGKPLKGVSVSVGKRLKGKKQA